MAITLAPAHNIPTITWGACAAGAAASTVIAGSAGWYREKRTGVAEVAPGASQTSTANLDLTGSTYYSYPGILQAVGKPSNPGNYVTTELIVAGDNIQYAYWPFQFEFVTSSPVVAMRYNAAGANPPVGRILVDGLPVENTQTSTDTASGAGFYVLLTFPDSRSRTITIKAMNASLLGGWGGCAVAAGYTIAKPIDVPPLFVVIGDEWTRGGVNGTGGMDTFAYHVAQELGYGRGYVNAGIGITGFVKLAGSVPDTNFQGRASAVAAMAPVKILIVGGAQDATAATGVQAAVTTLAGYFAGAEVFVASNAREDTKPLVRAAVSAGAVAAGVHYLATSVNSVIPLTADAPTNRSGHIAYAEQLIAAMSVLYAPSLFLGSQPIGAIYRGSGPVHKIYLGSTKVWEV